MAPCWSRLGLLWSSPALERGYQCGPGPSTRRELPHPTSIHHASTIRIHMHPLLHTHAAGIHRSLALLSLADPHRLAARAPWSSYALLLMQEPWLGSLLFYYYEAQLFDCIPQGMPSRKSMSRPSQVPQVILCIRRRDGTA